MKYAEIILPLPLANTFTYRIPEAMSRLIRPYCRVVAPFGKKHYYTGVALEIHDRPPTENYEIKEIFLLLDEKPIIRPLQHTFWQWISSYYLCTLGEVFRTALPVGLKPESETVVMLNTDYETEKPFHANRQKILDALSASPSGLSVSEIEKKTGLKNQFSAVNTLLSMGAVEIRESMKRSFKPRTETYVRLADHIQTEADLQETLTSLKQARQQKKLFLDFLELSGVRPDDVTSRKASKSHLLARSGVKSSILNNLIKRGILATEERVVSRIEVSEALLRKVTVLSEPQQKAYDEIKKSFETKNITLLHGVAASGKTEIYIRLIRDVLSQGLQALYLLPEIAVSTQLTERLRCAFGEKLFVYNSSLSDNERVEIWNRLLQSDEPLVVLGARSSLFLPFARLGLAIVDEEQEPSYKQQDPAPRYHARNAAMMLALRHGGKTLLGSATPSLESYLWAKKGKYGFVTLDRRYGECELPKIEWVNVRELRRKRLMKDTLFSPLLKAKIDAALAAGEQAILFRNRRGFAPLVSCQDCGEAPHCINCDVSLTYHKRFHRLICHYCNYSIPLPSQCPHCGAVAMKMQGFGTEKVEEEVAVLFPQAKTARLDLDTARSRNAYRQILGDFEAGKTQILVGTQMVTKGLDFANVSVVGILNADGMMNIPDFRAYERAFQVMLQAGGRAGRRDKRGWVVLQTSQSDHPLLHQVQRFDYEGMAQTQLQERYAFHYPPYARLILLVLRSRNEKILDRMAGLYAEKLRIRLDRCVAGPIDPPVTRIQTLFVRHIMLRMNIDSSISDTRRVLDEVRTEMQKNPFFRQIILHYDVDPQ
jgi:primosomal protein N' (replication factor Y)